MTQIKNGTEIIQAIEFIAKDISDESTCLHITYLQLGFELFKYFE